MLSSVDWLLQVSQRSGSRTGVMVAVNRLRALRLQLLQAQRLAGSTGQPAYCSADSGDEVIVVSWGMSVLSEEDQTALDQVSAKIGRPIRVHHWSEDVEPLLRGSVDLSTEQTTAARAEVKQVLSKAVAWLGAPLRFWDPVKALVREECGADWPPCLQWIHNTFTGVDMIAAAEPPSSVAVTNMRGRFDVTIAEFVLTWMLMACKQMAVLLKQHEEAHWPNLPRGWRDGGTTLLRGKTVAIIGLGSIGTAMANMYSLMGARYACLFTCLYHNYLMHS